LEDKRSNNPTYNNIVGPLDTLDTDRSPLRDKSHQGSGANRRGLCRGTLVDYCHTASSHTIELDSCNRHHYLHLRNFAVL